VTDKTSLGDRMKTYEEVTRAVLPRRTYTIIRVDGRAFHTLLRHADKPFDRRVADAMEAVAVALCTEASGAVLAYQQSDEVSVLLSDFGDVHSEPWFGGVVQKVASVSASIATVAFAAEYSVAGVLGQFDARVFTIPSAVEVANYFTWRQRDALRNAISMAAQAHFSHRQLQGVDSGGMQEMLWSQKGVNFNDYPDRHKRGSVITRVSEPGTAAFTDRRTGGEQVIDVTRHHWRASAAPRFSASGDDLMNAWLATAIPPLPALTAVAEVVEFSLVRDALEALCRQRGLSLDSEAAPGFPARNYELADRLGIGEVFGLKPADPLALPP
jgi:tRNA(His) 5'-end guanylyltransferase